VRDRGLCTSRLASCALVAASSFAAGALAAPGPISALALAAAPVSVAHSARSGADAPRCVPSELNRSALLAGTNLAVSPLPDSYDASQYAQISLLGAPLRSISRVRVTGSASGSHPGRLRAYSQGDGASFLPSRPFMPGETVSVRGRVASGARSAPFAFHFVVARGDVLPYAKPDLPSGRDPNEVQHFVSRADLEPPVINVTARSPQSEPGYVFAAPYGGPGKPGPMIFDEAGNLVWFHPLPAGTEATNLQVQQLNGQPVLTWWQGYIPPQGFGEGEEVIDDNSYREIARVQAGNGYEADLHDFRIAANGTALVTVFAPIDCDLSAVGGPGTSAVTDSVFQELDLATGLVRREWHSLDHVALENSYSSPAAASAQWPFDYFHINSIDQQPDGITLISARNTSTLYELNAAGQVLSEIGGRHSSVKLAANASTAYQHDATALENGTISVFDNGGAPKVHPQSRGLVVAVSPQTKTATIVAEYEHPNPLSSASQGDLQPLANQDVFIGWGSEPYFSEFSAAGQLLFDAHMDGSYESYRAYRFPWSGAPAEGPAIGVLAPPAGQASPPGSVTVYASWNGDTRTASWTVLGGPSPQQLAPVASAPRSGFETAIATPAAEPYVAVQAVSAFGGVLGVSATIKG
jgi:hypothetical protein